MSDDRGFKEVPIAVALALRDGRILLLQRKDPNPMFDRKWEFPGGKIESGEDPESAMHRELFEETGLRAKDVRFLGTHTHDWHFPEKTVRVQLHCFHCSVREGDVRIEDRSAYGHVWTEPERTPAFDLLEANLDLIKKYLLNVPACADA